NAPKPENSGEKIESEGVPGRKFMPLATVTICAMDRQHFTQSDQLAQFSADTPGVGLLATDNIMNQFSQLWFNYLSCRPICTSPRHYVLNLGVDSLH
ncbi:MAG: hypothetical protein ACYSOR_06580, partial [Planctomycetota bacterium]